MDGRGVVGKVAGAAPAQLREPSGGGGVEISLPGFGSDANLENLGAVRRRAVGGDRFARELDAAPAREDDRLDAV